MGDLAQWVPVIAALSGVIIGFLLGFVRDGWEGRRQRKRLAVALLAEMRALLERYDQAFGAYIRQLEEGKPLETLTGAFHQEFFAVFDGNTDKVGLFKAEDAKKIVRAYVQAKGHLESLNLTFAMIRDAGHLGTLTDELLTKAATGLKKESQAVVSAVKDAMAILSARSGEGNQPGARP